VNSIKNYVTRRLGEGERLGAIWREVEKLYPHRCAGWGYMLAIKRREVAQAAHAGKKTKIGAQKRNSK